MKIKAKVLVLIIAIVSTFSVPSLVNAHACGTCDEINYYIELHLRGLSGDFEKDKLIGFFAGDNRARTQRITTADLDRMVLGTPPAPATDDQDLLYKSKGIIHTLIVSGLYLSESSAIDLISSSFIPIDPED